MGVVSGGMGMVWGNLTLGIPMVNFKGQGGKVRREVTIDGNEGTRSRWQWLGARTEDGVAVPSPVSLVSATSDPLAVP